MHESKPEKGLKDGPDVSEALGTNEKIDALIETNSIVAVALCRIYDVLMCQYAESDEADARKLRDLHQQGKLRSQIPWLEQ